MNKCGNCGVTFRDPTTVCPLCRCITESDGESAVRPTYPRAEKRMKRIWRAMSIYTVAAIAAEGLLLAINIRKPDAGWWSIITLALFVYGYITLRFSIQSHCGYQVKMLLQTLLGAAVLIVIDELTGAKGWSMNYVLPSVFMLIDLAVIILMIVNNRNWQSYIPMQLLIIALCVIPFVLRYYGLTTDSVLCVAALGISVMIFVGTLIVGGRRATDELYRRFHV